MKIHGKERPKYTSSCMTKDVMPVARTSFCIQAYQVTHRRSATFRWALYLETSSYWDQYVPADSVEFLEQWLLVSGGGIWVFGEGRGKVHGVCVDSDQRVDRKEGTPTGNHLFMIRTTANFFSQPKWRHICPLMTQLAGHAGGSRVFCSTDVCLHGLPCLLRHRGMYCRE